MKPERPCPACAAKMANFFAEKNGHRIFKCLACSSLFVSKLPSETASIYGEKYFWGAESGFGYVDYDTDKEPMRKVFEQCVERISQISGRKGRLVDIGAATGYFMKLAKKMGWEAEGVEIGREAAEVGRRQGLKMLTATIAELSGAEKFDAITMFDVIEHVKDPEADFRKAHDLLKDDGALVIITPNSGSLYARLLGKRWHLIVPPEHLSYFTRAGMQTLLEKSGFQVIEMKAPGKWFTLEYILHTLLRWQGLGVWRGLLKGVKKFPRLANVRLPVNFRDNMLVFARKI
ncbi:MAG: class I SAM-dependent methyltransferase [Candidatus Taylorbacteria bacterium]|nr:class I SAM-dependent methyltransferase [Candidatus Taylorbacteria bacterium]